MRFNQVAKVFKCFVRQFSISGLAAGFTLLVVLPLCAERLPIKTYTVADGLLRDSVYKIKQDSRGFLWFCTQEGISRFDGYAFTNFTTDNGLPDRHVNDFLETSKGTIYIATDKGLARLNPTGISNSSQNPKSKIQNPTNSLFTAYLSDNESAREIHVLFEDETGRIFVGTSDGLFQLTEANGQIKLEVINLGEPPSGFDRLSVDAIIKDRRGALWIGTDGGLIRITSGGAVERYGKDNGLPDINISALHEDANGRIWIGLRPRNAAGLCLLVADPHENSNVVERHYTTKEGLPADWITDLFESSDGKFWVATTRGLCEWQGGENSVCKTYTSANDLCDQEVPTITEDKDKNLWAGTQCGLKKWTRYGFTTYAEANGTNAPNADSIFENRDGELFASFNDGAQRAVNRFDGERFESVKPNFPPNIGYFGWGWKQTVWQDAAGDWWFPTGAGLFRFRRPARFEGLSKATPQKILFGAQGNEIFRFFEDSHGDFWIATTGTASELWHWQRTSNAWENLTQEASAGKSLTVSAFVEDRAGNLWIGTGSDTNDTALIRWRDGQFKIFTRTENELLAGWIRDLFVDDKGRLWIADTATGALRLDDVNADRLDFKRYTPAEGLSSIGILCITEDQFGRIYIGTGRGLDRLNPETGQVENFTTADGLPNSSVYIAYRDRKNNLWFATNNGLARFVPESERQRKPPNVLITGLRVNGESQNVSVLGENVIPALALDSDQRQVTVDFLGLGASLGEKLKYEYRFDESNWTPTAERTVNFANLATGEYRFEVRAQTADRLYSQPALVSFRIAAPLWQRWWFVALILLLIVSAIYLFYKNRLARLLEMERMRTRIATDLHDDIGANLTRISLLSEVAKQNAENGNGNLLTSIADIARESVASMNDIVWAISPEHDSLLDLTRRMRQHAEEIFALRDIDLDFRAPASDDGLRLSVGVRRDVLLIFKEAVNNAARHSNCTKVEIDFYVEHSVLNLKIADNGKGFDSETLESDGHGLRSMTRRGDALGGKLKIDSLEGRGTTVKFELSLPKISFEPRL
ncbi:MAG: histidine kinase [Acidobacteriota bacterium]|nr:histidine kinase [Acidobacteriota bacterium]